MHDPLALSFLSLSFWKKARKTTKKTRIFKAYRTPKIPGKEGKNARKNKEFLAPQKKKQGKEGQGGVRPTISPALSMIWARPARLDAVFLILVARVFLELPWMLTREFQVISACPLVSPKTCVVHHKGARVVGDPGHLRPVT